MSIFANMSDEDWDREMRERFPNGPLIHQAILQARGALQRGEEPMVVVAAIHAAYRQLEARQIVALAGGIVPFWDIVRGQESKARMPGIGRGENPASKRGTSACLPED